jgi:homoaconitase
MKMLSTTLRNSVLATGPTFRRSLATHAPFYEKDCSSITPPYAQLIEKWQYVRELLNNRPLTLAEKTLYSHLNDPEKSLSGGGKIRGESYLQLTPQRVAMQDASAQYVIIASYSEPFLIMHSFIEWLCMHYTCSWCRYCDLTLLAGSSS